MLIKNDVSEIPLLKCDLLLYLYLESKGFIILRYDSKNYYFYLNATLVKFIENDYLVRFYIFMGSNIEKLKGLIWKN
jgi:hypothetical protein